MRVIQRVNWFIAMISAVAVIPCVLLAGDLDPAAGPDDPASAMYTVEDIYDYLTTGVAGSRRGVGFTEPTAAPGSTGRTLDEIHARIRDRCITCEGTLNGTRWCDQGDGTIKDMITGLVWLQNASWGGQYAFWVNTQSWINAHDRAASLTDASNPGLSDGSVEGDWRLPTRTELYELANGTEAVRPGTPRAFSGVQADIYWSSTTVSSSPASAWAVQMNGGIVGTNSKAMTYYVWPIRADN